MKIVKSMQTLFALALVSTLVACATNGPGYVTDTMSDADFISADASERNAYLKAVVDEDRALQAKKDAEYYAGRPVPYGDSTTGYTMQWDKKLKLVHVYPGHSNGMMGIDEESLLTLRTDDNGNILYEKLANGVGGTYEKPTIFLANVATQEGLGRAILKGGFQVVSAGVNGALAAEIYSDGTCGDNCGNIFLNNGASANSGSNSNAGVDANIGLNLGCPSGNCTPIH